MSKKKKKKKMSRKQSKLVILNEHILNMELVSFIWLGNDDKSVGNI